MSDETPEPKVLLGPAKLKHQWHDDTDYVSDPVMEGDERWVGRFKSDTGCEVKSTNFLDPLHYAMLARIAELEARPTEADLIAVAERAATLNITLGGPHATERAAAQALTEWRNTRNPQPPQEGHNA